MKQEHFAVAAVGSSLHGGFFEKLLDERPRKHWKAPNSLVYAEKRSINALQSSATNI
jgi:hypothetical protein